MAGAEVAFRLYSNRKDNGDSTECCKSVIYKNTGIMSAYPDATSTTEPYREKSMNQISLDLSQGLALHNDCVRLVLVRGHEAAKPGSLG